MSSQPVRVPTRLRPIAAGCVAIGLVVACGFVYWPVLGNGFVNFDDPLYIVNNPQVRRGLTPSGLEWAFSTFHGANWFPLTWLSWMTDIELFGLDARAFHRTSVILHAAGTVGLFFVFARSTGRWAAAAFVAAVFALHPLHVESVAWASARKDVLSGVFWMLASIAHVEASMRTGRGARVARALVAPGLALGLMAKPTLVVLPFVLLLMDAWPLRRLAICGGELRFAQAVREKWPLFGIVAAGIAMTLAAQSSWGAVQPLEAIGLLARLDNALVACVAYLGKAFWPVDLAVFYPHPTGSIPGWKIGGSALFLVASSFAVWRVRVEWTHVAVGWLWFGGALVPVIGIVQVGQAAMADRYMYLPLVGLSIAVAYSADRLASRSRAVSIAFGTLAIAALVALGFATRAQVRTWKDSTTLFEHALSVTSRNHVAHINLGAEFVNQGRYEEAEFHLRRAIALAPRSAVARGTLGDALRGRALPEPAIRNYRAALAIDPDSARWLLGLGGAQLDAGATEAGIASIRRAAALDPSARTQYSLGAALQSIGAHREAIAAFERALAERPDWASARGRLGVSLLETGQPQPAVEALQRAIARQQREPEREPRGRESATEFALFQVHLARALEQRDGAGAGLAAIDEALRVEPDNPEFHSIAAALNRSAGRTDAAVFHYRRAVELGDRSVGNLNNLAWLLATRTETQREAVDVALEAAQVSNRANPDVLDTLSLAYAANRNWRDAIDAAEEALALGVDATFAEEIRKRVENYRMQQIRN